MSTPTTALLQRLHPVASLSPERLEELRGFCFVERIPPGHDPFRMDDTRQKTVWLLGGRLSISFGDGHTQVFSPAEDGAIPTLPLKAPILRATAIDEIALLRIDSDLLDILLTWDQLTQDEALQSDPHHMVSADSLRFGALAALKPAQYRSLLAHLQRIECAAGTVLIREGDAGDYYYLLEQGAATITRQVGGTQQKLAEVGPGAAFGEEALVSDNPRNATVTLTRHSILHRLSKQDFSTLLKQPLLNEVDATTAQQAAQQGATWLDVRFPSEYQHNRLDGAFNIPLNEIRNAVDVLSRERRYLCYCDSGRRAAAAAFLLAQNGYQVSALRGGLQALSALPEPTQS
ncbi:cyclic nucleotide-binding domain-containing protein [Leeia sp.]|uniref:cyclic nucleotide-binding domain-containing protein n=1 Tax=Leeia sp. TaxID=2884678 RepID=UPI0035AE9C66